MSAKRVWISQCLCPQRHCIMANAGEAESRREAEQVRAQLHEALQECLDAGVMNPWCGICHAGRETWHLELGRTACKSLDEARDALAEAEAANLAAGIVFGEILGAQKQTKH